MKRYLSILYQLSFVFILTTSTKLVAMSSHIPTNRAIDNAIIKYCLKNEPRMIYSFKKAHIQYPPQKLALLAFKKELKIELWAKNAKNNWRYIKTYPLTASSGKLGPKLKEYDKQIPEGIYKLTMFNPYSRWHLSMMINYPNEFDKMQAKIDRRYKLGGDIFLHGKNTSIGCLAVGDKSIEELFLLVRRVGLENVQLIISPNDLRLTNPLTNKYNQPSWLPNLYKKINLALHQFAIPNKKI